MTAVPNVLTTVFRFMTTQCLPTVRTTKAMLLFVHRDNELVAHHLSQKWRLVIRSLTG